MKSIYAIIVSYNFNRNDWLNKCLTSLKRSSYLVNIIVVDNNSTDNSVSIIKSKYPEVILFEQKENLGFAKANNIAIRYAYDNGADFVFLLNQDAWIEKDTVAKLVEVAEKNPDYGVISPIHLSGDYKHFDKGFLLYFNENIEKTSNEDLYYGVKKLYTVSFVNAAAWLVSKKCIETVGGFDTLIFHHYGEDYNYSQRLQYHNLKLGIYTGCTICHDRFFRVDAPLAYEIEFFSHYGNPNYSSKRINHPILYFLRALLKSFVKLNFGDIKSLVKEVKMIMQNKSRLLQSRKANSSIGMNWL